MLDKRYMLVELFTGANDGIYLSKPMADKVFSYLRDEKHPWGLWAMVEVLDLKIPVDVGVPRFHMDVLKNVPYGTKDLKTAISYINGSFKETAPLVSRKRFNLNSNG